MFHEVAWLTRQQIPFGATLLKAELLQICKQHKPTQKEYEYDCLRVPAYHADLNSIELIWATMKGYKMTDVIQLTHDAIAAVTEDDWVSSCRHVEEVERKYWDAHIAVEAEMEKIVVQVTSSDEDTDTATECSDSTIIDILRQSLPGFTPLSVMRPRHYLET